MTNSAALGYAIKAAKACDLQDREIQALIATMQDYMDMIGEARAEIIYQNF